MVILLYYIIIAVIPNYLVTSSTPAFAIAWCLITTCNCLVFEPSICMGFTARKKMGSCLQHKKEKLHEQWKLLGRPRDPISVCLN